MSIRVLSIAVLILALADNTAPGQIVINEFAYDDTGEDNEEYVELHNAADVPVELSGWRIDTGTGAQAGGRFFLPPDTSVDAGGYLVLGSPLVPGVDLAIEAIDFLGNGPSYLLLVDDEDEVVDSVVYEANKGLGGFPDNALMEGGIWGNHVLVTTTHLSWQRWSDGLDTDENGADFGHLPWTPGASNDRTRIPSFSDDFEEQDPETVIEELPGSFVPAIIIDPTKASVSNPNAILESPNGGNALIAWDPAGGGNFVVFESMPVTDLMFEAWVYFDATPKIGDGSETWSIGLRGTSGTFFNLPILFDANGNTGVTWTYQVTAGGAWLYLVDEGLGRPAASRRRLGEISIVSGENDGWRRLRLEVRGNLVVGYFDGTFGSTADGIRVEGTLDSDGIGSFYIGYREALPDITLTRPPTLDALEIRTISAMTPFFRRGDGNADGALNLSDTIFLLNHLFLAGPAPGCESAADGNDDGALNLSDAIYLLNHLFLAGDSPPPPFDECGPDPTADDLACGGFPPCP